MPATHTLEDEVLHTPDPRDLQPSMEYYGDCSVCCGSGSVTDLDALDYGLHQSEPCGNCGGDGKSVRVETEKCK